MLGVLTAGVLALVITAGVLASDELQYNSAGLAPTARYEELAKVDRAFAGKGPALLTDFDEYSLYSLRDLDVGAPDFIYPAARLERGRAGLRQAVLTRSDRTGRARQLPADRRPPRPLRATPAARLPARVAGHLLRGLEAPRRSAPWRSGTPALRGGAAQRCATIAGVARSAGPRGSSDRSDRAAARVRVDRPPPPAALLGSETRRRVMKRAGTLRGAVTIPRAGWWDLWLRGQLMPSIDVTRRRTIGSARSRASSAATR